MAIKGDKAASRDDRCRAVVWRDSHSQARCKCPSWKDGYCRDHYQARKKKAKKETH